jgi:hypothetical protein
MHKPYDRPTTPLRRVVDSG